MARIEHRTVIDCFVLFSLAVIGLTIACSRSSSRDPNSIKFLWFGSEEETAVIRDIVRQFEEDNPDVTVVIQMVEWLRYNEKLLTMLLGHRAPDIARISVQWCKRYAELEAFADISHMIAADEYSDFVESRLASCRDGERLFGLPHSSIALMMYYNVDLIEKAGIQIPQSPDDAWTWDELEENCRKTMKETGVHYGWSTFRGFFPLVPFFYQRGGRLFDDSLSHSTFARSENIKALEWFIEQHRQGIAPPSSWTGGDPGTQLFMRGYCAFHIIGNWSLISFSRRITEFKWDVTYLPRDKRRATNVGGENLVIFNTGKEQAAVRLLRYLTDKEQLAEFSKKALFIPTRKSLLTPDFTYEQHNEAMQKFIQQSLDFEPEWAIEQGLPAFSELEKDLIKHVELSILGEETPAQALKAVDSAYENLKQ